MNEGFFWYALPQKEKEQKRELEKQKVRKTLETRNVTFIIITNLRIPSYASAENASNS